MQGAQQRVKSDKSSWADLLLCHSLAGNPGCRAVDAALQEGDFAALLARDQLRQVQAAGRAFQVCVLTTD
jgi:hypothetical protein